MGLNLKIKSSVGKGKWGTTLDLPFAIDIFKNKTEKLLRPFYSKVIRRVSAECDPCFRSRADSPRIVKQLARVLGSLLNVFYKSDLKNSINSPTKMDMFLNVVASFPSPLLPFWLL